MEERLKELLYDKMLLIYYLELRRQREIAATKDEEKFENMREKAKEDCKSFEDVRRTIIVDNNKVEMDCFMDSLVPIIGRVNATKHLEELRQKFNFTNSLSFDIGLLILKPSEELLITLKAIKEEIIKSLDHASFCFLSNALLLLICSVFLCQGTLFNCKKKSRLKYQYEKATLLILWRCGDVEQNPGPAKSDITRDFCKKMISMLVDKTRKLKPEEKTKRTNKYETEPDGWPKDVWYGDPSKGTNIQRYNMLKTLQETCTDNGVEVPTKWLNLIEKYLLDKEANAGDLYSWLYRHRFVETLDQMSDRLSEMKEEDRYEILEHFIKLMKPYYPDLSSQYLQSRKLGPKSRKMKLETQSTVLSESKINCATDEVATFASCTTNINAVDLLAVGVLDPNGTSVVQITPEINSQKTSNDSFVAGNNERSTAQPDNLSSTSFFLLGDNTACFAASNTTVTPLPCACENNGDTANGDYYRKRKLDTREIGNEIEIATKRYKMSDCGDCETVLSFPNGDDVHVPPFDEIFPSAKENGIQSCFAAEKAPDTCEVGNATVIATKRYNASDCRDYENAVPVANDVDVSDFGNTFQNTEENGFVAEETLKDLMAVIEPELHEIDTIPYHNAVVKPGEVQGDIYKDPMLDELSKYLSDEFIMEHSLTT